MAYLSADYTVHDTVCCSVQGVSPLSSHSNHDTSHRGGPGVGVRLNSRQVRGRTSLSQVNDRERVKLDKFTSLLSAANVSLGQLACQLLCDG